MAQPLEKYVCYNPKTNEVIIQNAVVSPELTPIVYGSFLKSHDPNNMYCFWEGKTKNEWDYGNSSDPRIPKEFKVLLTLMEIPF